MCLSSDRMSNADPWYSAGQAKHRFDFPGSRGGAVVMYGRWGKDSYRLESMLGLLFNSASHSYPSAHTNRYKNMWLETETDAAVAMPCHGRLRTRPNDLLVEQIHQPFQVLRLVGRRCLNIHLCPPWGVSDPCWLLIKAFRTEPTSRVVSFISCLCQGALNSQGFKAQTKPRQLGRASTVEHFIVHLHKMSKYVHATRGHISGSWQPVKSASVPQEKLMQPTFGIYQQKLIPWTVQQGSDLQRCWDV